MKHHHPFTSVALLFVAVAVLSGVAVSSAAPTEQQQCLAAHLKAIGKNDACRLKAEALAVLKGGAADDAKCAEKFADAWQKAQAKYGADCPGVADTTMDAQVVQHVSDVLAALGGGGGECSNEVVEAGEECDGADLDGQDCTTQGFDSGVLACDTACTLDTSGCVVGGCSLLAQNCATGEGCYPAGSSNLCLPAGTTPDGGTCTSPDDCVAGSACVDFGGGSMSCAKMCDTSDGDPGCGSGFTCVPVTAPEPNVGVCVAP